MTNDPSARRLEPRRCYQESAPDLVWEDRPTRRAAPCMWEGPSLLLSAAFGDDSAALVEFGYHLRRNAWERGRVALLPMKGQCDIGLGGGDSCRCEGAEPGGDALGWHARGRGAWVANGKVLSERVHEALCGSLSDEHAGALWLASSLLKGVRSFELEVVEDEHALPVLKAVLGSELAGQIDAHVQRFPIGHFDVSANREQEPLHLVHPQSGMAFAADTCDLRVATLPYRQGNIAAELVHGWRWARLYLLQPPSSSWGPGLIVLWGDLDGIDDATGDATTGASPERVSAQRRIERSWRWPHFGIPSRAPEWFAEVALNGSVTTEDRVKQFVFDLVTHEEHFLDSCAEEAELWEISVLERNRDTAPSERASATAMAWDFRRDRELYELYSFLDTVRRDLRVLRRRSQESGLIAKVGLTDLLLERARGLDRRVGELRSALRDALGVHASVAMTTLLRVNQEIERTSQEARAASERLGVVLSLLTALVLVPTLVASVFGGSVHALNPTATGSLSLLVLLMIGGAAGTGLVIALVQRTIRARRGRSASALRHHRFRRDDSRPA